MAAIAITQAELLEALAAANPATTGPDNARTMMEISEAVGLCERHTRRGLQALAKVGRIQAFKVIRPALDGRMARVPAYVILPKP